MRWSTKTRAAIKLRARAKCEVCGLSSTWWHYQHRRARGMGGSKDSLSDSPANGLLCHGKCHLETIEAHPGLALENGWRVRQGVDPAQVPVKLWDGWFLLLHDGSRVPHVPV